MLHYSLDPNHYYMHTESVNIPVRPEVLNALYMLYIIPAIFLQYKSMLCIGLAPYTYYVDFVLKALEV
jgi:hypothetical protein